jgi:immune inhibitor A
LKRLLYVLAGSALAASLVATPAAARQPLHDSGRQVSDNFPTDVQSRQAEARKEALQAVLRGDAVASGKNSVVNIHRGRGGNYVELAFEGEDQILTLLGQFGANQQTHNHGAFGTINHGGTPGPLHNEIPEPDRTQDNTTIWVADFNQAYYDNLLYNRDQYPSMANFYLEQSSGAYTVDGYVSDWIQLPNNAAAYGSNYCGSIVCTRDIGRFIEDQVDTWWPQLVAQQGSEAAANAWLAQFDVWDRYDYDGDGNFDEPDGYIDHFQSVHAGIGEETCNDPCEDLIWSHRSGCNCNEAFGTGPGPALGGAKIGNSNYWIYDYTIEPENGGVGVFSHEFAHDLGLPDEYDTSGNTGGAENSTGWWTIMSQGSYGTQTYDLGTYPTHFNAWDKLQLGFIENYSVAAHTEHNRYILGPAEFNTPRDQALVVVLPDIDRVNEVWEPYAGEWMYYSQAGADLDNTMTRSVTLPAGTVTASFKAKYHIEPCWDYAYLQVSTNGGTSFTNVHTSASAGPAFNANGQDFGEGITGISGHTLACDDDLSPDPEWTDVTADLSAYAGQTVLLRFRYWTDGFTNGAGFTFDNLQITGLPLDDAETDPGWTYDGFIRTDGTFLTQHFNAYVIENRQCIGYDDSLCKGPYNFGFPDKPNFVEHFKNQNGMLVWYWDERYEDNNVGDHPGHGLILPVDSHPKIFTWKDGSQVRPRINAYDAPFSLSRTEKMVLHNPADGVAKKFKSQAPVSVFRDNNSYWVSGAPSDAPGDGRYQAEWNSVITPHLGTVVKIVSQSPLRLVIKLNP